MTDLLAHQIATKALGGEVYISAMRDRADGAVSYAVAYRFGTGGTKWLCAHRFQNVDQAQAGAVTLADFLGCEVRP